MTVYKLAATNFLTFKIKNKMNKEINNLPPYFVIKRDETNPLWKKYIDWLNDKYDGNLNATNENAYYGFDGDWNCEYGIKYFNNYPTLITLEYWNECVNGLGAKLKSNISTIYKNNMEQRKIIGYEIIKEYPLSPNVGLVIKSPHILEIGYLYPENLKPVYEEEKLEIIDWYENVIIFDQSKGELTQEIINKIKEVI